MRAVRRHTDCKWVLLYIERWLKAPVSMPDGTLMSREKGTPQGAVVSPILANLFLHYAFDRWMGEHHPGIPFERYADDIICHCGVNRTRALREALERFAASSWNFTRTRRRSCTARMPTGVAAIRSMVSTFWAIHFGRESKNRTEAIRQFRSRSQRESGQAIRQAYVGGGCIIATIWPWGSSPDGPDRCLWLGSLLREFPCFCASWRVAHAGPLPRAMGATEIQTTPRSQGVSMGMVVPASNPPTDPVCPLGVGVTGWTIGAG